MREGEGGGETDDKSEEEERGEGLEEYVEELKEKYGKPDAEEQERTETKKQQDHAEGQIERDFQETEKEPTDERSDVSSSNEDGEEDRGTANVEAETQAEGAEVSVQDDRESGEVDDNQLENYVQHLKEKYHLEDEGEIDQPSEGTQGSANAEPDEKSTEANELDTTAVEGELMSDGAREDENEREQENDSPGADEIGPEENPADQFDTDWQPEVKEIGESETKLKDEGHDEEESSREQIREEHTSAGEQRVSLSAEANYISENPSATSNETNDSSENTDVSEEKGEASMDDQEPRLDQEPLQESDSDFVRAVDVQEEPGVAHDAVQAADEIGVKAIREDEEADLTPRDFAKVSDFHTEEPVEGRRIEDVPSQPPHRQEMRDPAARDESQMNHENTEPQINREERITQPLQNQEDQQQLEARAEPHKIGIGTSRVRSYSFSSSELEKPLTSTDSRPSSNWDSGLEKAGRMEEVNESRVNSVGRHDYSAVASNDHLENNDARTVKDREVSESSKMAIIEQGKEGGQNDSKENGLNNRLELNASRNEDRPSSRPEHIALIVNKEDVAPKARATANENQAGNYQLSDRKTVSDTSPRSSQEAIGKPPKDAVHQTEKVGDDLRNSLQPTSGRDQLAYSEKVEGFKSDEVLAGKAILSGSSERRFTLRKSLVERTIGKNFEKGMTYEIEGVIEGVGGFRYRHIENRTRWLSIHLPKEYSNRVKLGETYRIKITRVNEGHELDVLKKQGRHQDEPQEPTKKSKRRLGRWIEKELSRMRKEDVRTQAHGENLPNRNLHGSGPQEQQSFQERRAERSPEKSKHQNLPEPSDERLGTKGKILTPEQGTINTPKYVRDEQKSNERTENRKPLSWEWVAGFFDGEGAICYRLQMNSIGFELNLSQKYKPLLDEVALFLKNEGIPSGIYRSKIDNVHTLFIRGNDNIKEFLEKLQPYLSLKERQAWATMAYLENEITGNQLVQSMNDEITAGRRSGKLRKLPGQTLTHEQSVRNAKFNGIRKARSALYAPLEALDKAPEE